MIFCKKLKASNEKLLHRIFFYREQAADLRAEIKIEKALHDHYKKRCHELRKELYDLKTLTNNK